MMITLLCCGLLAFTPPLSIESADPIISVGPDSLIKLGTGVKVSNMQVGDTIAYRYFINDTLLSTQVHRTVGVIDTFRIAARGYGTTTRYKSTVQIERGGRNSGNKYPAGQVTAWMWSFTRPIPPPTIDSVWKE